MPCCALVVSLSLPDLYLGVWGDNYTRIREFLFLAPQKNKNKNKNLLYVRWHPHLGIVKYYWNLQFCTLQMLGKKQGDRVYSYEEFLGLKEAYFQDTE